MKKLTILLLVFFAFSVRAQVSDEKIQDTIDLYITPNNAKSITAAKLNKNLTQLNQNKLNKDSAKYYGNWTLSDTNISNNNTGNVTISQPYFYPLPPYATPRAIGRVLGAETNGQVKWNYPIDLYKAAEDSIAKVPTSVTQDRSTSRLEYWKADYSYMQIPFWGDNANIMVIGDSYAPGFADWLKMRGGDMAGFGGGFEIFEDEVYAYNDLTRYCSIGTGWTASYDASDTKNFYERYAESSTAGSEIKISAVNFNKLLINYRQKAGDGVFSVRLGDKGVAENIDCNGSSLSKWWSKNYGNVTYMMPSDTVIIRNVSGTTRLYGFSLEMHPYSSNYQQAKGYLSVHDVQNPGSAIRDLYTSKDTASIHRLIDSLQVSLCLIVFLDSTNYDPVTSMDSLVHLLQIQRPEMDILIVNPYDQFSHLGSLTAEGYKDIAQTRQVGYFNAYKDLGTYDKLAASGAIADNIHLGTYYYGIIFKELWDMLLYPVRRQSRVDGWELTNRGDYMLWPSGSKNMALVSWKPGRMAATAGNTLMGFRDILFKNHTGTGLTLLGCMAGNSNTTGEELTGVGMSALESNTVGNYNTAVGSGALKNNSTGSYNTAVGRNALFYPTTKSYNTAIGWSALGGGLTSNSNTAIGHASLVSLTSGASNTATGSLSGYMNSTGDQNVFFGANAGYNSTYSYNCYFGYQAGYRMSSGYGNVGVGTNALLGASATSGSLNTAIGYQALFGTTGAAENNTALGANAGLALTTGDDNVLIGQAAGSQLTTQSNQLYIENSNSVTPLIGGDFSTDQVTINGTVVHPMGTLADNDASPSVAGKNVWKYNGTANAVSITALDDAQVGAFYTIIGNSGTYTITIPDASVGGGDSFNLNGQWVGGVDDVITLYCIAADTFKEVSRSDN